MTTPHHPTCCSNKQLHDLLVGIISDADSDAWLQHLEQCPTCQTKLHALAGEDGDWSQAREVLSASNAEKHVARSEEWAESLSRKLLSPPSHPEMLGRIGRYDIEWLLGSGGMGIVFKGFDTELHRTVAIKVLAPALAYHGTARHRFAKEARAAAAVVHEDVVPIYDVDADREVPYLVMRYVPGESLQARIDRVGPLELKQILRIGKQVTAGLAAAHAQGLIHRDVKPSNVLLEEGIDRALLTDFGLAQAIDDANTTASGVLPGTPQYMSPEQARGEKLSVQSDLFSAGSVLYAMCTGRPPFRAETSLGVLQKIRESQPKPIRELNPEIPSWLAQIIETLMAKDPKDRYASASEVSGLLEQCLAHVQHPLDAALPATLRNSSTSKAIRSRLLKFAIAGALAIGGIGLCSTLLPSTRSRVPVPTLQKGDSPPASIPQPSIVEWKVVPLPPTPEDKILSVLEETIEVDWKGLPLEQALAELLGPITLDYRGYVTKGSEASEFESTVQLRHRATRKQILQRVLGARELGYIVRPSEIEVADLEYVRDNPPLRRYCLSHVSDTSLEAAEVVQLLNRMLGTSASDSVSMILNGPNLLVRATESEHEQIIQVLAALATNVQP
ncbi:MAG: serine/threonine protein kinase [Planctomycetes bacterium]|nr:serine/threonine protein kinase [Planctomycetota bacterium]